MYKATLASYGQEQLPRYQSARSVDSRLDSLLVLMARQAINLTNFVGTFDRRSLRLYIFEHARNLAWLIHIVSC